MRSFGNAHEGVYDLIEPYILNKIQSLTEKDLVMAIYGFYNPELTKRYNILDVLESTVINQASTLSKDTIEVLLNFYREQRTGSRILIETLIANQEGQSNAASVAA